MTEEPHPPPPVASAAEKPTGPVRAGSPVRRLLLAARVVQVRLRFVAVLFVAFLVVGLWGPLRNVWDTLTHRLTGSPAGQHSVSTDTEYFCPMCPGVLSDWPAICPVCNMDLVRRKRGEAVVLPEGLVARMQFSPYRIQLAGIKTSVVRRQPLVREFLVAGRLIESTAPARPDRSDSPAAPPAASSNLFLTCDVYAGDLAWLTPERRAEVVVEGMTAVQPIGGRIVSVGEASAAAAVRNLPAIEIALENPPAGLRAGMYATARVSVPVGEIEPWASALSGLPESEPREFVAVPETAVVDSGSRRVVFVETMAGMFDGVEVNLGPRCGEFFPVLAGLEAGQRVATIGAFLIDAEARLSRNVAASYFGAARSGGTPSAASDSTESAPLPTVEKPKQKAKPFKLSAADRLLAAKQKICPVTGAALESMGGPIAVEVQGQRVFICCQGCAAPLKKDPQKYLAKLRSK